MIKLVYLYAEVELFPWNLPAEQKQKVLLERLSHQTLLREQQQSTLGKVGYEGDKGPGSEHVPSSNCGNSTKFRCLLSEKLQKWHLCSPSVHVLESHML